METVSSVSERMHAPSPWRRLSVQLLGFHLYDHRLGEAGSSDPESCLASVNVFDKQKNFFLPFLHEEENKRVLCGDRVGSCGSI